jgi:hypothetical protein
MHSEAATMNDPVTRFISGLLINSMNNNASPVELRQRLAWPVAGAIIEVFAGPLISWKDIQAKTQGKNAGDADERNHDCFIASPARCRLHNNTAG